MRDDRSRELFERLAKVMPGANTRTVTYYDPFPIGIERGEGAASGTSTATLTST